MGQSISNKAQAMNNIQHSCDAVMNETLSQTFRESLEGTT
jgi:hypothetical protein